MVLPDASGGNRGRGGKPMPEVRDGARPGDPFDTREYSLELTTSPPP
jgi:hypothetical protein